MRRLILGVVVSSVTLALPAGAAADHGGDCHYAESPSEAPNAAGGQEDRFFNVRDLDSNGTNGRQHVVIYQGSEGMTGTADIVVGVCVNLDGGVAAEGVRVDGGSVEAGGLEDPVWSPADPDGIDTYLIVDGDNDSADPLGLSDGYVGLSNYETGATRDGSCADGPDEGTAGSSNSGGCLGIGGSVGKWVGVPYAPLPVCGSDGAWDSTARDGCTQP